MWFCVENKLNNFQSDGKELVWRKPITAYDKNNTCSVIDSFGGAATWLDWELESFIKLCLSRYILIF